MKILSLKEGLLSQQKIVSKLHFRLHLTTLLQRLEDSVVNRY